MSDDDTFFDQSRENFMTINGPKHINKYESDLDEFLDTACYQETTEDLDKSFDDTLLTDIEQDLYDMKW